jgi:hypothetical protein
LTADTVYGFKVTATNSVGESLESVELFIRAAEVPDAPTSLANVAAATTAGQVALEWAQGPYNGGSPVVDFQVWVAIFKQRENDPEPTQTLVYSEQASGVQSPYIVTALTTGYIYSLKVKARNLVGYSEFSADVQIQAAQVPDAPSSLSNVPAVTNASQIGLAWQVPASDGGSEIISYKLWTDNGSAGATFTTLASDLTSLAFTMTGL